jgi:hypothetical protein
MALTILEVSRSRPLAVKAKHQGYLLLRLASLIDWEAPSMSLEIEIEEDILRNEGLWCDIYRKWGVSDRIFDTSCGMSRMLGLNKVSVLYFKV